MTWGGVVHFTSSRLFRRLRLTHTTPDRPPLRFPPTTSITYHDAPGRPRGMSEVEEYRSISMKGKAKRKDVSPITQQYGASNSPPLKPIKSAEELPVPPSALNA